MGVRHAAAWNRCGFACNWPIGCAYTELPDEAAQHTLDRMVLILNARGAMTTEGLGLPYYGYVCGTC